MHCQAQVPGVSPCADASGRGGMRRHDHGQRGRSERAATAWWGPRNSIYALDLIIHFLIYLARKGAILRVRARSKASAADFWRKPIDLIMVTPTEHEFACGRFGLGNASVPLVPKVFRRVLRSVPAEHSTVKSVPGSVLKAAMPGHHQNDGASPVPRPRARPRAAPRMR